MSKRTPNPSGDQRAPNERRGRPTTGRIVRMQVGQGQGYIREANGREVYFHRSDLKDRSAFNDLRVGDAVRFELLEDAVSGARALRVTRPKKARTPED